MSEMPQLTACNYSSTAFGLQGNDFTLNTLTIPDNNSFFHFPSTPATTTDQETPMSNRRIVQVFIVDPNENIPLEKSLLYQSEEPFLTDLTDQELFFEIDIKNLLDKHNEYRVTVTDKDESSRDNQIKLEKAKIRDLKMVVTQVAQF